MGWFKRNKPKHRKVSKGTRRMGQAVGWANTVRCNGCGHVYNPDNHRAAEAHANCTAFTLVEHQGMTFAVETGPGFSRTVRIA